MIMFFAQDIGRHRLSMVLLKLAKDGEMVVIEYARDCCSLPRVISNVRDVID